MRVFVTGATGFIGSHLTERLVDDGYTVKALVRESGDVSLLESHGVEIVYGDIRDLAAVEKAASGCEQAYHLAARTSRHRSSSRHDDYEINVEGTKNVAHAALRAGIQRLVYGSSAGVYGFIKNSPVDEETKPSPNTPYRESKLLGEESVLSYHKKEGLPVVIARLSSVFGPRSQNWLSLFQAITTNRFRMIGSGENHAHMGFVSDVVDGLRRCAEVKGIEGEAYIIAGKEPVKLKQFVGMIADELGIGVSPARSPEFPFRVFHFLNSFAYRHFGFELPRSHTYELFLADRIFDISKAQKELGYDPKVSMRDGIRRTVEWYREKGYIKL